MIEVTYKKEEQGQAKEKQDNFKIPNNIRQIGEVKGNLRIYIEDYAYTFLKKLSQTGKEEGETAVLFGERHWKCGEEYIFIKSALRIEDMKITEEQMVFTEKIWSWVYENGREYFPGQNVMGWFLHIPEYNVQITEQVRKTHEANFSGKDKVLFIMDPGEQEEAFYIHENSMLQRQNGFYVYYEKNEPMQSYMIAYNKNKSIEDTETTPDRAVIDFRKVFAQKEEDETEEEKPQSGKTSKTLQICAAVALVVLGGTAYNHYRTVQSTSGVESAANADAKEDALSVNAGAQMAERDKALTGDQDAESESGENTAQSSQEMDGNEDAASVEKDLDGESTEDTENGEKEEGTNSQDAANTNNASAGGESSMSTENGDTAKDGKNTLTGDSSTTTGGSATTGDSTTTGSNASTGDSASTGSNATPGGSTSTGSNNERKEDAGKSESTQQTTASGLEEYTIRRGDTLTGICQQKYGSIQRMDEICEINNIKPEDIIYAGQKIFLPD